MSKYLQWKIEINNSPLWKLLLCYCNNIQSRNNYRYSDIVKIRFAGNIKTMICLNCLQKNYQSYKIQLAPYPIFSSSYIAQIHNMGTLLAKIGSGNYNINKKAHSKIKDIEKVQHFRKIYNTTFKILEESTWNNELYLRLKVHRTLNPLTDIIIGYI
jgi:hypothetical protein